MVEIGDISSVFAITDERRARYRLEFSNHFGELEPNALLELMKVFKDDQESEHSASMREIQQKLVDKMLVVGGKNEVAMEQLRIASIAYEVDSPAWNALISMYEAEQRGENHGKN